MSFIEQEIPGGKRAVRCRRCDTVEHFVRGDLQIPKWKRAHRCPPPAPADDLPAAS